MQAPLGACALFLRYMCYILAGSVTLKSELSENRKQIITLTNFVLASALQRADGNIPSETVETLKDIIK